MKLRSRPEDFIVREECLIAPEADGPYGLYRLRKRGLTTPEAVRRVARAAGIEHSRIRYCGLKDRHAIAEQTVTVFGRPVGPLRGKGFELEALGRAARAARSSEIARNAFRITIRDLARDEAEAGREQAAAYARTGIPNYFDEQRFGSARATGEFPAAALCSGEVEKALRLVIATWSREDPVEVKRTRRLVDEHWGRWEVLKAKLPRSTERSIVTYLVDHPRNFVGAFDRLPESLRGIVLAAFQSLLWNETLSAVVAARTEETWSRRGRYDTIVFFAPRREAAQAVGDLVIPMAHRSVEASEADVAAALEAALGRRGLTRASFRLRGFKKTYFWRGERPAVAQVHQFDARGPSRDELNAGRWKLELSFALPAGAYGTMFVKAAMGQGRA